MLAIRSVKRITNRFKASQLSRGVGIGGEPLLGGLRKGLMKCPTIFYTFRHPYSNRDNGLFAKSPQMGQFTNT